MDDTKSEMADTVRSIKKYGRKGTLRKKSPQKNPDDDRKFNYKVLKQIDKFSKKLVDAMDKKSTYRVKQQELEEKYAILNAGIKEIAVAKQARLRQALE